MSAAGTVTGRGISGGSEASRRRAAVRAALAALSLLAAASAARWFGILTVGTGHWAAIDLRLRYDEVHSWFAGQLVYRLSPGAVYPPASYVLLWPAVGWPSWTGTRWLWAATSALALLLLARLMVRESGATRPRHRWLAALLLASTSAAGVTIGNGQLGLHLLLALLAGVLVLEHDEAGWRRDLLASALFVVSATKPTFAAPLLLVPLVRHPSPRVWSLLALEYGLASLGATVPQHRSLPVLMRAWLEKLDGAAFPGYNDVHSWLNAAGLRAWSVLAGLSLLAALAAWLWRTRHADPWVLLGVAAVAARVWTYHRDYDDILLVVSEMAVLRLAIAAPPGRRRGLLWAVLVANVALLAMPALVLIYLPWLLGPYRAVLLAGWLSMLACLLRSAGITVPGPHAREP